MSVPLNFSTAADLVDFAIQSIYGGYRSISTKRYDFDYEEYNRMRLEKYQREARRDRIINKALGIAFLVGVIAFIISIQ